MDNFSRLRVAVLMGGPTPEYEVSLSSGIEVVKNLDKEKYSVLPIVISRDGKTFFGTTKESLLNLPNVLESKIEGDVQLTVSNPIRLDQMHDRTDVAFIAIHGPYGEDGTIQKILENSGIKYAGSGPQASGTGMDKVKFRNLMCEVGVKLPKFVALKQGEKTDKIKDALGAPPYFVKPHNQGSSVGNSLVKEEGELQNALEYAWKFSPIALVDEYIKGTELTCALLGNETLKALPVVEIIPANEFFDYDSKYTSSKTQEVVPARIPGDLQKRVQDEAIKIHQKLGCRGFSRTDFILKENGELVVLEINTIPGLTPSSLFPKAAKASGMSYSQLLDTIIRYALE